ncbi:MAG: hypothetical protein GXO24_04320 [Chlorobi bacterium]|nr:hypothetical protein [Chlorobiota bacterium]
MTYSDYLKLRAKQFFRSPLFQKKLITKLFTIIGLSLLYLEVVGMGILTYFILEEQYGSGVDLFRKLNDYDYMYFMFAASLIILGMNTTRFDFKPLMILPVPKKKITGFVILDYLLSWPFFFLFSWLVLTAGTFIYKGYPASHILTWMLVMMAFTWILGTIYFVSERNQWWNFLASALMIAAIITTRQAPQYFSWLGKGIYRLSMHPSLAIPLVLTITFSVYYGVSRFLRRRLYLQHSTGAAGKAGQTFVDKHLGKWDQGDFSRAFMINDIRLMLRNVRPKSVLFGAVFSLVLSAVFFFAPIYRDNKFMQIFAAMLVSGAFMYNFGGFIPAWDSSYIKLLVSQGINFRQYVEAKWRLLVWSVVILSVLALPYWFIDRHIYMLILAFSLFNAGLNGYLVLWGGLYNLTPIKLDEKVKAFQSGQSFNGKLMIMQLLKMIVPLVLYFGLKKFLDEKIVLLIIGMLGLLGLMLKDKALDLLAEAYKRRKYDMVVKLSAKDE